MFIWLVVDVLVFFVFDYLFFFFEYWFGYCVDELVKFVGFGLEYFFECVVWYGL